MDDAINIYSQTVLKRLAGTALSAMLTFFNLIDGTFVVKEDIFEIQSIIAATNGSTDK